MTTVNTPPTDTADGLLIVEDLLLVLVEPRSGSIAGEGTLYYTLGGAVLVELALLGAVDTEERSTLFNGVRVRAVKGAEPSDPLLRAAYDTVAEKSRGALELLIAVGAELRGTVIDRLAARGYLATENTKVLGLFPSKRLSVARPDCQAALLGGLRAVLSDGAEPDTRTAALAALVSASGSLPQLHPAIPWSGDVYRRGKELESGSWGADAVGTAVTRTAVAIATSSAAAAVAASTSSTS